MLPKDIELELLNGTKVLCGGAERQSGGEAKSLEGIFRLLNLECRLFLLLFSDCTIVLSLSVFHQTSVNASVDYISPLVCVLCG